MKPGMNNPFWNIPFPSLCRAQHVSLPPRAVCTPLTIRAWRTDLLLWSQNLSAGAVQRCCQFAEIAVNGWKLERLLSLLHIPPPLHSPSLMKPLCLSSPAPPVRSEDAVTSGDVRGALCGSRWRCVRLQEHWAEWEAQWGHMLPKLLARQRSSLSHWQSCSQRHI